MQFIVLCVSVLVGAKSVFGQCGEVVSMNKIHQTPWLVYMEYYRRGFMRETMCGGTLISSRHVVTAAHCARRLASIKMAARLGEYDVRSTIDCVGDVCSEGVVRIAVEETIIHPGYDRKEHDIAILKLDRDAPYTDFIRPICLPTGHIQNSTIFVASGWGEISRGVTSQTTKSIHLPFFPLDKCRDAYPAVELPDHIICAGGEEGIDTCRGDSGGPLVVVKDRVELWGVVSEGYRICGTKGKPGIYTSIVDHLDWIREVMNEH